MLLDENDFAAVASCSGYQELEKTVNTALAF
jgi:hypothetical protein